MSKTDFDAIVIGSGPNGLAAAITLQQTGKSVLLIEGKNEIGGGLRTQELTLPGYLHDVCSAVHPLAIGSPFFKSLPLQQHGLNYMQPTYAAAHPLADGSAAILSSSLQETAQSLGIDEQAYLKLISPIVKSWPTIADDVLGPLTIPKNPLPFVGFGLKALTSSSLLAKCFQTEKAKALWAGMAAHSIQPLEKLATSAIGLVLMSAAHINGWPIPQGGSISIANALASYFTALGGKIETGTFIKSLAQLPSAKTILFDVTPKQLLEIAGHKFSSIYKWQLERYTYGMGVFKIDWALDAPVPFTNEQTRQAGTVHLGNTFAEIAYSERQMYRGIHVDKPYVLLAQPSILDSSRAPKDKHVAWAYCHVPHGSTKDMTAIIENQVERFAPGFKDTILAKHTFNTQQLEEYNPNYIGGDISAGAIDLSQIYTRPALRWSPYKTSTKGMYICSASTPPGAGVHGMCGYHAAKRALKDIFNEDLPAAK